MRDFLRYFLWTLVIGIIVYIGLHFRLNIEEKAKTIYQFFPLMIFDLVFPIIIGMLLRLPKLINEIRVRKQWRLDWSKLLGIGVPLFCLMLLLLLTYTSFGKFLSFGYNFVVLMLQNPTAISIIGLVFGYTILDSLKKQSE